MNSRHSKIVCTIGPATRSPRMIRKLIAAGMDVARLNFSHGTHQEHAQSIAMLCDAAAEHKKPLAILADLQGPKIRTGALAGGGTVLLRGGQKFGALQRLDVAVEGVDAGEREHRHRLAPRPHLRDQRAQLHVECSDVDRT